MKKAQTATEYLIILAIVIIIALIVWFAMDKDPFDYQRNQELMKNLSIDICSEYEYGYGEQRADYVLCYAIEHKILAYTPLCNETICYTKILTRNITIPVYIWVDWELERNKSGLWKDD